MHLDVFRWFFENIANQCIFRHNIGNVVGYVENLMIGNRSDSLQLLFLSHKKTYEQIFPKVFGMLKYADRNIVPHECSVLCLTWFKTYLSAVSEVSILKIQLGMVHGWNIVYVRPVEQRLTIGWKISIENSVKNWFKARLSNCCCYYPRST